MKSVNIISNNLPFDVNALLLKSYKIDDYNALGIIKINDKYYIGTSYDVNCDNWYISVTYILSKKIVKKYVKLDDIID